MDITLFSARPTASGSPEHQRKGVRFGKSKAVRFGSLAKCCEGKAEWAIARSAKETDVDERRLYILDDVKYGITTIELIRRDPEGGLGIIVIGGADTDEPPRISQIRPGSPADRSDALEPGDFLVAVNGVQTARLTHDEIINLLKQAGQHLRLEIKFPLPPIPSSRRCIQKETSIFVKKENESFGLTIRGSSQRGLGENGRALYILTRIRPGSPADRDGLFRVGDRIVAVDGVSLEGMPHAQMLNLLRRAPSYARFTVQYDVQIFDAVVNANGPLSVEIDRAGARMGTDKPLGMNIVIHHDGTAKTLAIDSIIPASIADSPTYDGVLKFTHFNTKNEFRIVFLDFWTTAKKRKTDRLRPQHLAFCEKLSCCLSCLPLRCGALTPGDRIDKIDGTDCSSMSIQEAIQLLESTDTPTVNMQITPASVLRSERPAFAPSPISTSARNGNGNDTLRPLRNHSPPPLPRPPAVLYATKPLRDPPPDISFPSAYSRPQPEYTGPAAAINRTIEVSHQGRESSSTPTRSGQESSYIASRPGPVKSQSGSYQTPPSRVDGSPYQPADANHRSNGHSELGGSPYQQALSRGPEITYHHGKRDGDDGSDDGSFYEKTSSNEENEGVSFLVVIDKRPHESWGISLAYRRQDGSSEITVHNVEPGGKAYRTEALRVGDTIAQINGKSMRNATLQEAYLQLACDYVTLKVLRKSDRSNDNARHSPADSANSSASVDSAVESWESNHRPQQKSTNGYSVNSRPSKPLSHSVSAHHVAEVESVSLRIRGSESIPERLDHGTIKPSYREAENLKNSIEMMDQILTLNDSWSERRATPNKSSVTSSSLHPSPAMKPPDQKAYVLDSLLEDLATMRTQNIAKERDRDAQPAPVIRRVKFQTPNGHVVTPATPVNGKSSTFEVLLAKDPYYEDFGFSLSDGAFERGVYVNRIRPSGPAELIGLRPCDQLLKVNRSDISQMDCCLAVPLIAAAGDEIRLLVSRRSLNRRFIKGDEADDRTREQGMDVLESDML